MLTTNGDVVIDDLEAARALSDVERVAGSLTFEFLESADDDALASCVSSVTHIVGDLVLNSCESLRFRMPSLVDVAGDVRSSDNEALREIAFPRLVRVDGALQLSDALELSRLDVSSLVSCGGMILHHANELRILDVGRLTQIGGALEVEHTSELKELSFPVLLAAGTISISENEKLEVIRFPRLREVGGPFCIGFNESLEAVEMPALQQVEGMVSWLDNGAGALPSMKGVVGALHRDEDDDDTHVG